MNTLSELQESAQPWWKHGHMWMVIGGPLIVVVASFVTLYLAVRTPDPVYADPSGGTADATPATQARNHAITGGIARKTPQASAAAASHP
jgi:hypothetical protein